MKRNKLFGKSRGRFALPVAILFSFFMLLSFPRDAQALLLLESYVFMGPRDNAAVFSVKNTAKKVLAYRVLWNEIYMSPDGKRHVLEDGQTVPGIQAASPYIYVSPRRMIIQGDQLQNLRFMLRRPKDLPAGEYRSYVFMNPEKIPDLHKKETTNNDKKASTVQVEMMAGYRLPVFFLQGETTLDVSFSDVHLAKKKERDTLFFTVNRTGTRSALGTINITCDIGTDHQTDLGRMDVKVYTEISTRAYERTVDMPPEGCGQITLGFTPHTRDPAYNGQPIASTDIVLR